MKRTQVTTRSSASLLLMFCMLHPQPFLPRVLDADQGSRTLAELVEEYYDEYSRLNPLRASATGDHRFDDQFPNDISEEYRSKQEALCRQYLQRFAKFKPSLLSSRQDQLSYQCLKQRLESDLEGTKFEHYRLMPLNQFSSNAILFPVLGSGNSYHSFKTVRDYDNFLGRIRGFQTWSDTAIANMRQGVVAGICLAKASSREGAASVAVDVGRRCQTEPLLPAGGQPASRVRRSGQNTPDCVLLEGDSGANHSQLPRRAKVSRLAYIWVCLLPTTGA